MLAGMAPVVADSIRPPTKPARPAEPAPPQATLVAARAPALPPTSPPNCHADSGASRSRTNVPYQADSTHPTKANCYERAARTALPLAPGA